MKKKIFLIILLFGIVFISLCTQQLPPGGGDGGGDDGGSTPCSLSLSVSVTGKDTCTVTATAMTNNCANKAYEIKDGGSKCNGTITSSSFSKTCTWSVTSGSYTYGLYIDGQYKLSKTVSCSASIPTCSDGTLYEQCSTTKPKYCDNGNLVDECTQCGCPSSQNCNSTTNTCYTTVQTCSDGTLYGQCSATKPKYCSSGTLINKCSQCNCPTNQNCNTTSEECYTPLQCSSSVSLNLTPSTIQPSSSVIPSASGLASCDNKIVYFKKDSCVGTQVSSCTLTNGGCTGSSFITPSVEGLYTYYACIDKNVDGDFTDSGESSSRILNVTITNDTTPPLLQNEIVHVDNSLEYLRARGLGIHDMAEYVISKSFLGIQIPNKQQIIDYFDNNQETDGSWSDTWTPMFTTHRILLAYYILNATPKRSLDSFFSKYDTWTKAKNYYINETKTDYRDIYHITLGWSLYHILSGWKSGYPPWLDTYFSEVEKEPYLTSWTTGTDAHRRTHILYNYVIAQKQFPNLDGIIDETLREQSPDGHWDNPPRQVYWQGMQLALLQQIIKLYPNHRTGEIQSSIDKSRQWVYDTYNITTVNGVEMGRFGNSAYIEDALMTGIMSVGINGLMDIYVDMTFSDIVKKIQPLNLARLPMTGIGEDYLLYQTNYTGAWEILLSTKVDKWKFNTVRLAFRFSDIPDGKTHSVLDYAKLDSVLTVLGAHGLKAILDLHNYQDMAGYFGSDAWINNWVAAANRYKSDGRVLGYELFNEPNSGTWSSKVTSKDKVTEAFANATDAIRQVDPNKPIIWASPYYWVENILDVTPIPSKDKRANVYYAVHPWNYVNSTEEAHVWSNGFVPNITHWDNVYDHSLWMGEFGVENSYNYDAQKYTADTIINWSVQNNVGFCWWLYSVNHWVQGSADDVIYNSNYVLRTP